MAPGYVVFWMTKTAGGPAWIRWLRKLCAVYTFSDAMNANGVPSRKPWVGAPAPTLGDMRRGNQPGTGWINSAKRLLIG